MTRGLAYPEFFFFNSPYVADMSETSVLIVYAWFTPVLMSGLSIEDLSNVYVLSKYLVEVGLSEIVLIATRRT